MNEDLIKACGEIVAMFPIRRDDDYDFDSHDLIMQLETDKYFNILQTALWEQIPADMKAIVRQRLHSHIGGWLSRNKESLGIDLVGTHDSVNYKGDVSENAKWKKVIK